MLQPRHLDSLFWSGLERKDELAQTDKVRQFKDSISVNTKSNTDAVLEEIDFDNKFYETASNSAKYMDDVKTPSLSLCLNLKKLVILTTPSLKVWISGHFSRKLVPKFAVPMDKLEERARWSGGGSGPSLDNVGGVTRGDMNGNTSHVFNTRVSVF